MSYPPGLFLIDKRSGLSSAQVVGILKRRLKPDKIGHAGTLDPMATGLLVCLVGRATRLADYALDGNKRYQGVIRLGLATDSDDITGAVISESQVNCSDEQILTAIQAFKGDIQQYPPKISAVKIGGERAYDLARSGMDVQLKARKVTVHRFDVRRISENEIGYDVACSKGTYIRSLARDLGDALGCGGTLASIRRTESSPFSVEEAKDVEEITFQDIVPWERIFPTAPRVSLSLRELDQLRGGEQSCIEKVIESQNVSGEIAVYCHSDVPCGFFLKEKTGWRLGVHLG